ncbi:MAG: hypothetical protein ABGY29_12550 [bacterium]
MHFNRRRTAVESAREWFEWYAGAKAIGAVAGSHEIDDKAFTCTIHRCWHSEFLSAHGQPRLTTSLGRLDGLWFNRMDPKRHGMRLGRERYTTQGYRSKTCTFPIRRA